MASEKSGTTSNLARAAQKYLWYPFTQMSEVEQTPPLIIERGEGVYLIDTDGNRYIDGVSSLWTNVHGHRHPRLDQAIRDQVDRIAHSTLLGLSNVPAIRLAEKLISIAPEGLTRVFYSDSGSTAVEIALKMAYQYHAQAGQPERSTFIALENAYHGDTLGSVSVGGIDLFHAKFRPLLFPVERIPSPHCYRCPLGRDPSTCNMACLAPLERILEEKAEKIAGVVMEPLVQGAAGMLVHPRGYLKRVRELTEKHGVLLILDEVATGFGKTGTMFACEQEDVRPDLMALAKGLSGGYLPIAATLATEEIYSGFLGRYEDFRTFFHGHTFTGNPLAAAVAIATLEVFGEEHVLEHVKELDRRMEERLHEFAELPHVGNIRRRGIMTGIELVADRESKEPYPVEMRVGHQVIMEARRHGVIIRPLGDVVVLMPPLAISLDELDTLLDAVYESIVTVTQKK